MTCIGYLTYCYDTSDPKRAGRKVSMHVRPLVYGDEKFYCFMINNSSCIATLITLDYKTYCMFGPSRRGGLFPIGSRHYVRGSLPVSLSPSLYLLTTIQDPSMRMCVCVGFYREDFLEIATHECCLMRCYHQMPGPIESDSVLCLASESIRTHCQI